MKDYAVQHAEDQRVDRNADGKNEDGDGSETAMAGEGSDCVAKVREIRSCY
jgi:hypothetical protein